MTASRYCAALSLSLDMDDRVALLGANGNGKSTFAKLLAGKLASRFRARCGAAGKLSGSGISPSTRPTSW